MTSSLHHWPSLPLIGSVFGRHEGPHGGPPLKHKQSWSAALSSTISRPMQVIERCVDSLSLGGRVTEEEDEKRLLEERCTLLRLQLQNATTLEEWRATAAELDVAEGHNRWKDEDESPEYNHQLIKARLQELDDARKSCDSDRMLFLIRTSLSRNLGGMGNIKLYKHSHVGTKTLVEKYIVSTLDTLNALIETTQQSHGSEVDSRLLLEQVLAARQSFGRSALLLSGGGTFGMSHIGVAKCLWEQRFLPRIVSGASAGSIVCAVLCTRTDDELPATIEEFCYGDLEVFTRTADQETTLTHLARFLKEGALFDVSNLIRVMRDLMGDMTFQEAYNRTRRILNITVSSASLFELPRLLNYITAPNVLIWSAVAASCSVPGVFLPAGLLAKDPKTNAHVPWNPSPHRYIDGSVETDLPMTRLAEMFNVNHFIVSQVNPHVVPFLAQEEHNLAVEARKADSAMDASPGWISTLANLAKDEAMHRMQVMAELGFLPNTLSKARSVLSQKYSGDITILPEVSYSQFHRVLVNPTPEFMLQSLLHGERATWPKLSRIQNHCAIELGLDDAVQHLRARIAFSPSQVDLRMTNMARPVSRAGSESGRSGRRQENGRRSRTPRDRGKSPFQPNSSRPLTEKFASSRSVARTERRRSSALKLNLQDNKSPMFSTGSEADTESKSSASSTPTESVDASRQGNGYFTSEQPRSNQPLHRHFFPHASQPVTPASHRYSYFTPRPPTPGNTTPAPLTSTASMTKLSMTPAVGSYVPGSRSSPASARSSMELNGGRDSFDIPQVRLHRSSNSNSFSSRSSMENGGSGTKGMLRRKKSSIAKGLKALTRPDSLK